LDEYLPNKPFRTSRGETALDKIKPHLKGEVLSDLYLQFLVTELKPFIDQSYRTLSGQENTYIMGSSMGGLISLYALCEYPDVFYGAGCLSTHWPIIRTLFRDYLQENIPDPSTHKIYFDFGTVGLDKEYEPHQKRIDAVMENAGYTFGENWLTQKFESAEHNEAAWRERIHIPLQFLLKK
jgi:predicted alpha/beta superfamily hydrolase